MGTEVRVQKIKELADYFKTFTIDSLDDQHFNETALMLKLDAAKDVLHSEVRKIDFDLNDKVETWLQTSKSERTRITYRRALQLYLEYLSLSKIHILDSDAFIADNYRDYLKKESELNPTSIKMYLSATSSFFTQLERWEDIAKNPFRGQKRNFYTYDGDSNVIPTKEEVEALIKSYLNDKNAIGRGSHFKRKAAVPMASAILIMAYRGLRIGAFEALQVKEGGSFMAYSKGKEVKGRLTDGITGKDLYTGLKSIGYKPGDKFPAPTTIQRNVDRRIVQLFTVKKFSCHSFRHFFAVNEYLADNNILRVKRLLNHASVVVTERYLDRLRVLE